MIAALAVWVDAGIIYAADDEEPKPLPTRTVRLQATTGGASMTLTIPVEPPGVAGAADTYVVRPGDTLFVIARDLGVDMAALAAANAITDVDRIEVGQVLRLRDGQGLPVPAPAGTPSAATAPLTATAPLPITERLAAASQQVAPGSPYYRTTWLTYYGRPDVPQMGIVGEHDVITLTALLKEHAARYDAANGPELGVRPAFHLVYGTATVNPGEDDRHLYYLPDELVQRYVDAAQQAGIDVILDIQVAGYTPVESIQRALPFLKNVNVHLAIDPEFAMVAEGQAAPGNPIGYVTAAQVNEVQRVIADYLRANALPGPRVLLVHQFLANMIVDKDQLDGNVPEVALTLSVDGFGSPWAKITKYNGFVDGATPFAAFKLFYGWDEPLLTEEQALGVEAYRPDLAIETAPNMVIYQ
jgi:LysM repeat protein